MRHVEPSAGENAQGRLVPAGVFALGIVSAHGRNGGLRFRSRAADVDFP